jgi:hypothetical protein
VIGPREFREWLRADPFRPFVVHLSDGASYEVAHRDFVTVGLTTFTVALPNAEEFDDGSLPAAKLSFLHVTRLVHRDVRPRPRSAGNGGQAS